MRDMRDYEYSYVFIVSRKMSHIFTIRCSRVCKLVATKWIRRRAVLGTCG